MACMVLLLLHACTSEPEAAMPDPTRGDSMQVAPPGGHWRGEKVSV